MHLSSIKYNKLVKNLYNFSFHFLNNMLTLYGFVRLYSIYDTKSIVITMNSEIIFGFLNNKKDPAQQNHFEQSKLNSLCSHINRDLPILITKVQGARRTVDVGLVIASDEDNNPFKPYISAGFKLFFSHGNTETERIKEG